MDNDKSFLEKLHGKEFADKWYLVSDTISSLKCPNEEHRKNEDGTDKNVSSMFVLMDTPNNSFSFNISKSICCQDFADLMLSEAKKLM